MVFCYSNNKKRESILKFNPKESDEYKQWSFLYQCDEQSKSVEYMENLTLDLVKGIQNIKEETYKVKS